MTCRNCIKEKKSKSVAIDLATKYYKKMNEHVGVYDRGGYDYTFSLIGFIPDTPIIWRSDENI